MGARRQPRSPRILVVDDDPDMRAVMSELIRELGYSVANAADGEAALRRLIHPFDLVITDLRMPRMGGMELLKEIATRRIDVPVIVVTAFGSAETAIKAGARDFLAKPFRPTELQDTVKQALKRGTAAPRPSGFAAETAVGTSAPVQNAPTGTSIFPFVVGGLAHDCLNTLSVLNYRASTLLEPESRLVAPILGGLRHLDRVLDAIQQLSRSHYMAGPDIASNPQRHLNELLDTFRTENPATEYQLAVEGNISEFDWGTLVFLAMELLRNSTRACASQTGAVITLRLHAEGDSLSFECCDTGPGFPSEVLARLRENRVRPDKTRSTGGYGLYLIADITQRLTGVMLVSNRQRGARVELLLPLKGKAL